MPNRPVVGAEGGAWNEATHMALYPNNFNEGLAKYIVREIDPSSVLEFGSGMGYLARYLVDHGHAQKYDCIEPNTLAGCYRKNSPPILYALNIFETNTDLVFPLAYQLVVSIEVAEHIERSFHARLFDFLVSMSEQQIVFSGARVGQGGHGHISERCEKDWKQEFLERGCRFLESETAAIRAACDKKNVNHRQNLMVFRVKNR